MIYLLQTLNVERRTGVTSSQCPSGGAGGARVIPPFCPSPIHSFPTEAPSRSILEPDPARLGHEVYCRQNLISGKGNSRLSATPGTLPLPGTSANPPYKTQTNNRDVASC